MVAPETINLPSERVPEIPDTTRDLHIDPNLPTWDQLVAQAPDGLVGLEWDDANGNTRRISYHTVTQIPRWSSKSVGMPKLHGRGAAAGGPYIGRDIEHTQHYDEQEYWTVDVIDEDGNLKEVQEYTTYGYQTHKEPPKFWSSTPSHPATNLEGKDKRLEDRARLKIDRSRMLEPLTTSHLRNTLKNYFNEMTGFTGDGKRDRNFPKRIDGFRVRDLPEAGGDDIAKIPVPTKDAKIELSDIKDMAMEMGKGDLDGLTWIDEDGDTKQIVRQFSADPKKNPHKHQFGEKVPSVYYLVRTIATRKDLSAADSVLTYSVNHEELIQPVGPGYSTPKAIIDPATGQPILETRNMHIYDTASLEAHFKNRLHARNAGKPLDLHFEIPKLQEQQLNDAHLIAEMIAKLWHEGHLRGGAPRELTDWLGRRATQGKPITEKGPEAKHNKNLSFNSALIRLNQQTFDTVKDRKKRSEILARLRASGKGKEAEYANILQAMASRDGIENIQALSSAIARNAIRALHQLGFQVKNDPSNKTKVLRTLVKSRYYAEHPDKFKVDGYGLTVGDGLANTITGETIRLEAADIIIGELFVQNSIDKIQANLTRTQIISSTFGVPESSTKTEAEQSEDKVMYVKSAALTAQLSEADSGTKKNINDLIEAATKNKGQLSDHDYAKIGRLLNRLAAN